LSNIKNRRVFYFLASFKKTVEILASQAITRLFLKHFSRIFLFLSGLNLLLSEVKEEINYSNNDSFIFFNINGVQNLRLQGNKKK